MSEGIVFLLTAMCLSVLCGAAFTLGAMIVCRATGWGPVTVHIHNPPGVVGSVAPAPSQEGTK